MKKKIGIYGGLFMVLVAMILAVSVSLRPSIAPSVDQLTHTEGVITDLHYQDKGLTALHDLYITLDEEMGKRFHVPNVSKLPTHNGCYVTNIHKGDKIRIYYQPEGYGFFVGEKNDIWRIERAESVVLGEEDVLSALSAQDRYYNSRALLAFFTGILLLLSCLFEIAFFCGNP